MGPHGLFEPELLLSIDEHETFMNEFELLWIETDIDLFIGQTNVDLLSFLY